MLLQWCVLEPHGPGNLAAIRFSSPVRVQSISIFPTDCQPFSENPEIVARTEPQAFYLEVYFNAHPVSAPDGQKPKATNALVPTVIAYAGGQMDFTVGMSKEHATRLMIVKGAFECVALAIYGEVASEAPSSSPTYKPKTYASVDPVPIPRALDPSNCYDPTQLARQLLSLIQDAPPLELIVRLMFCLKPSHDDWDSPDFPYLYPDLEQLGEDADLEQVSETLMRPVADDVNEEVLAQFAESVSGMLGEKDGDQAYLVAGILSRTASQNPELARTLVQVIDLPAIYNASTLDEDTLNKLLNAAANADIARFMNNDEFLDILHTTAANNTASRETRAAARQLVSRIEGWTVLEDALSNTQGDFPAAAAALADMSSQEASFGVWLACMITHQDLVTKLSENHITLASSQYPPQLLKRIKPATTHDDFVSFIRGFIGVSSVLAVYAWADSLPEPQCRERVLGILRLWQGIEGYREILNHLLMLRQMIFRLGCMLDDDVPSKGGLDAEHVLINLAENPQAIVRPEFIKCVLDLKPPHSFITAQTRTNLREAALMADDGVDGAVSELVNSPAETTPASLLSLRVALIVIEAELDGDREYEVMQAFWREGNLSILTCLVSLFLNIVEEISSYFAVHPPSDTPSSFLAHLFQASDELLRLIIRVIPSFHLVGRAFRALVIATTNLFIYTDAADMIYSQSSPTCVAAQETRQSCLDLVRKLADTSTLLAGGKTGAHVVLQTVLEHGLHYEKRDPAHHTLQVFCLIDYLLPMADAEDTHVAAWVQRVLPTLLRPLWAFCQVLDLESKAHFFRRLVDLDKGVVGIGDWLMQEELKEMSAALNALTVKDNTRSDTNRGLFRQYQLSQSLRLILDLISSSSAVSRWLVAWMTTDDDAVHSFAQCLWSFVEQDVQSLQLASLAQALGEHQSAMHLELKYPLSLVLLQSCRNTAAQSSELPSMLKVCRELIASVPPPDLDADRLGSDLGAIFRTMEIIPERQTNDIANELSQLLTWFVTTTLQHKDSTPMLRGITSEGFAAVCDAVQDGLDPVARADLDASRASIILMDDITPTSKPIYLPDTIEITLHEVEQLLAPHDIPSPSTPPRKALNQDVLSLVAISPPTALIRSPSTTATGLTKTYTRNDFRQLRQTPSARQNTSRLPSMHVDDFESASSPPTNLSALPPTGSPVIALSTPLPPTPMMFGMPNIPVAPELHAQPMSPFQPMK
ncbi:hypothetical protein EIP91_005262 [Steccherinum ochraceum]|uniref:Virilizer N-terminal domain-containing protein n=1 Tax=Steccherinum ochraceum TaxID=92696 RepID=A0A4R0RS32_9APHY|nr:hypothetical protein EIP91_005262 [Steccherinum ochraceum]